MQICKAILNPHFFQIQITEIKEENYYYESKLKLWSLLCEKLISVELVVRVFVCLLGARISSVWRSNSKVEVVLGQIVDSIVDVTSASSSLKMQNKIRFRNYR